MFPTLTGIYRLTQYTPTPTLAVPEAAALLAGGCGCGEQASHPATFATVDPTADVGPITWSGVIGVEGELTGDGRYIEGNALRWEGLPIPLRYAASDVGGHDGAEVVGRILTIERRSGGQIWASGDIDGDGPAGHEAARQVDKGLTQGISMDLDSVSFEIRVARELLEGAGMLGGSDPDDEETETESEEPAEDDEGRVTVVEINSDDEVMATTDARIRAATIVAIPAFSTARITLDAPLSEQAPEVAAAAETKTLAQDRPGLALVAAAAPAPPREWFEDPQLDGPTPLTVQDDGRVYGHIAVFGTCHTGFSGQCVEPPRSPSGYAYFRTGAVLTREGSEVSTGSITLDTLHAGRELSAAQTVSHYEHTGKALVDVAAGDDQYGVWVAGAARSTVTPEQVRTLRASPLSGDWRRIGGHLELVGVLAVNVPGFPVPRPQGLVASGVMTSLVASGMLVHRPVSAASLGGLSLEDLRYLKRLAVRERATEAQERAGVVAGVDALAARVRATEARALARRVRLG